MINKKNKYNFDKTKIFFQNYPLILIYQQNNLTAKQNIDLKKQLQFLNNVSRLRVKNTLLEHFFSCLKNDKLPTKKSVDTNQFSMKNNLFASINNKQNNVDKNNKQQDNFIYNLYEIDSSFLCIKKIDFFDIKKNKINKTKKIKIENKQKLNKKQIENILQGPIFLIGCHNLQDVKNIWNILKNWSNFIFLASEFNNQILTHLDIEKSIQLQDTVYNELLNICYQQLRLQNTIEYSHQLETTIFNFLHYKRNLN